jgi:selenium-binding protein 1
VDIKKKTGLSWPHTTHCLGSGEIMISYMGDETERAAGNFVLLDGENFEIKGKWTDKNMAFGYDFWYQPRHNVMVSTEWGEPAKLRENFNPAHVEEFYGHHLQFWDWTTHRLIKSVDLGADGS